ncbi:PREDICTED: HLA class II histocompatibility antigen, DRB1-10 beta chain-like [Dipodomys ordii]|uniref:HLA class II histocompatibility antigen, DRB1-10 beta chain-like n=1 Tax=Dipodomys ordii TaxID=10020 RepID=A0A1S3GNM7_DIPOR|nr:PREDICTED: HLA class II histocompatibility antigen, DRB1-10 beta chain-like [Dipodomys ordii]
MLISSMVYPRLPGGFHMAVMMVLLMVLSLPLALTRDFQPRFLLQAKSECHFFNGTQRLVFMERRIHNQEEYLRFDSSLRKFIALTELGQPEAETWNKKASLEEMAAEVDRFCRHNYEVAEAFTVQRREPQSGSVQGKMMSGVGGFVLGLLFLGAGLFVYFRNS